MAARLARFFGITVDSLLDDTQELPPDPIDASAARILAAKEAAMRLPENQPAARQAVFENTLARSLHADRMHKFGSALRRQAQELVELADEIDPPAEVAASELSPDHEEVIRDVHAEERREDRRAKRPQSSPAKAQGGAGR
jgi:hypothetical protein